MGLFSGVKKAVSSVANSAKSLFGGSEIVDKGMDLLGFNGLSAMGNSAKSILGSQFGSLGLEALGTKFGLPGLGSIVSGMFGGPKPDQDLGTWLGEYMKNSAEYKLQQKNQQEQYDKYYAANLAGIREQNTSAKQIADAANRQSQANAREAMAFTAKQAANAMWFSRGEAGTNRNWQEKMANTAHQREVADLRKAGLNPLLSGTGGMGAPTPSGNVGTSSQGSGFQGSVVTAPVRGAQEAVASAFDIMRSQAEALKASAATDYMKGAQTEQTRADTALKSTQGELNMSQAGLNAMRTTATYQEMEKIKWSVAKVQEEIQTLVSGRALNYNQMRKVQEETANLRQTFRSIKVRADLDEKDAAFWDSFLGTTSKSAQGSVDILKAAMQILRNK